MGQQTDPKLERDRALAILLIIVSILLGILVFAIIRHFYGVWWGICSGIIGIYLPWWVMGALDARKAFKKPIDSQ